MPPQVVVEKLKLVTRPDITSQKRLMFLGRVEADGFQLRRDIWYRNSLQAFVRGRIEPYGTGSRLTGFMSIHPIVAALVILWESIMIRVALAPNFPAKAPVSFGAVLVGVGMIASFAYEVVRTRQELSRAVEGT